MYKYFYSDCVITDIRDHHAGGDRSYSASVDGQPTERLVMEHEVYRYLTGVGKGTKNRVWFLGISFGKKRKSLEIIGMETTSGERRVLPASKFKQLYLVTVFPIGVFILSFIAAWILMLLPSVIFFRDDAALMNSTLALVLSGAFTLWLTATQIRHNIKVSNLDGWPQGETSKFNKVVIPAFGSGLSAQPVKKAKEEPTGW